jgi:hypothetical protein
MKKVYDLAVKVGEYTDGNGNNKGRYENIGAVMKGDKGPFLMLKRTFNPAGVPNPDNRDSVLISCFEPRDNGGQQQPRQQAPQQSQPEPQGGDDFSDDIPF